MKHWYNAGNTLHPFGYNGKINHEAGITIEDGEAYIRNEPGESLLSGAYTTKQLIDAFEEAIVWLRAQQRAADPFHQAMDSAVKRLADMGITASWMASIQSGMEVVPEYFPGTSVETGNSKIEQVRPNQIIIDAKLYFSNMDLRMRGYKWRNLCTRPNANSVEVEFNSIEEVERFIADNAHLAN